LIDKDLRFSNISRESQGIRADPETNRPERLFLDEIKLIEEDGFNSS